MKFRMKRQGFVPTRTELSYMRKFFGVIPIETIAADLDISAPQFLKLAKMLNLKLKKKHISDLLALSKRKPTNPNPVTDDTKMLICRYYYEGSGVENISAQLGRSKKTVCDVLEECMKNGDYIRYNRFGREGKTKCPSYRI